MNFENFQAANSNEAPKHNVEDFSDWKEKQESGPLLAAKELERRGWPGTIEAFKTAEVAIEDLEQMIAFVDQEEAKVDEVLRSEEASDKEKIEANQKRYALRHLSVMRHAAQLRLPYDAFVSQA